MAKEKTATEKPIENQTLVPPKKEQPDARKYIVNVGWIDVAKVISAPKGRTLKRSQVAALKAMVADKATKKSLFDVFLENGRISPKPEEKPEPQK